MKKLLVLIIAALLFIMPAQAENAHTRSDVRSAYAAINDWYDGTPYASEPGVSAPYAPGEICAESLSDACDYLNFIRWLAYIDTPVSLSRIYNYQCQHGAVLLAALDRVSHDAPIAPGMDRNFYESAHNATLSGNIAKFNWMRPSIIREGVEYFVRDDGDMNLSVMGHRRWVLNPLMSDTGFGLANSESGMSYVVMYAHDLGAQDVQWQNICWPSRGAFPADLMHTDLAWSVTLNEESYIISACRPVITLTEETGGLHFKFDPFTGNSDGFCNISFENYGSGPCIIFRPDFSGTDFTDYQQNQKWTVHIDGLYDIGGNPAPLTYEVDMISLFPQDPANVEISHLESTLSAGENLQLSAKVIPAYADDLSLAWRSTDPAVATVDENGLVTAIAPGRCDIIASSVNGREDFCELTVN